MSYQQLTDGKRYQMSTLLAQGCSPAAIATVVDVHRSTVYREMKRSFLPMRVTEAPKSGTS